MAPRRYPTVEEILVIQSRQQKAIRWLLVALLIVAIIGTAALVSIAIETGAATVRLSQFSQQLGQLGQLGQQFLPPSS